MPVMATQRRNTVLARMVQTGVLSSKAAAAAEKQPLGVQNATPDNGCTQAVAGTAAFFCNYVEQVILQDSSIAKTTAGPGPAAGDRRPEDLHHSR